MKATTRNIGDVKVIDLDGKFVMGGGYVIVQDEITRLVEKHGAKNLLIQMKPVTKADDSAVTGLVALRNDFARVNGATIKLLDVRIKDDRIFTRVMREFECYDDEAAAIRSFA